MGGGPGRTPTTPAPRARPSRSRTAAERPQPRRPPSSRSSSPPWPRRARLLIPRHAPRRGRRAPGGARNANGGDRARADPARADAALPRGPPGDEVRRERRHRARRSTRRPPRAPTALGGRPVDGPVAARPACRPDDPGPHRRSATPAPPRGVECIAYGRPALRAGGRRRAAGIIGVPYWLVADYGARARVLSRRPRAGRGRQGARLRRACARAAPTRPQELVAVAP